MHMNRLLFHSNIYWLALIAIERISIFSASEDDGVAQICMK